MLMRAKRIRNALVVAPLSVAHQWPGEAEKFIRKIVPDIQIHLVLNGSGPIKKLRRSILKQALKASLDR